MEIVIGTLLDLMSYDDFESLGREAWEDEYHKLTYPDAGTNLICYVDFFKVVQKLSCFKHF